MLLQRDIDRLNKIAALCDDEANTWAEGFAVKVGREWRWSDRTSDFAHIHFIHLTTAARDLRTLANREGKMLPLPVPELGAT